MGLSNQIPSSRIAQAGVVPNTASRPVSPYEGQLIYQLDTNQLLIWNGSAWVMAVDTDTPPGLQLVKTQTIGSAVPSVTVTDAFSAEYDNYFVTVSGGTASSDNNVGMQFRTGTTTSADEYYETMIYGSYTGGSVTNAATSDGTQFLYIAGTSGRLHMALYINSPFLAAHTTIHGQFVRGTISGTVSGVHKVATSYDQFVITPAGGVTLTGGTIRVYGYRN